MMNFNPYAYAGGYSGQGFQPPEASAPIWVQGEAGAKAYIVPAGRTVWLMDSENPVFYIKSTDVNGMPQPLRTFDFTERKEPAKNESMSQYVTKEEMKSYIDELLKKGEDHESTV